ncbi:contact-dependent growth inhibition system immunity protein [Rhodopila sp.]|jgi:hypothetical protein|uniref:contact-dependent growth inhibition system immunity protein n=1 Tax=Rhodopila sp. TaxID=2480087 RepID=UPI002CBE1418|nr:contact-dependent growth inhibition system immunity protein [Rhodopila sp.]HVZ09623.1 contact-dependent growth inhibition system immunity protein [Rhodopila sp.]
MQTTTPSIPILHEYPYLSQLCDAYLFSDYTIYGPEPADAVTAYARDEGWLDIVAARADIRRFMAFYRDSLDQELARRYPDLARLPDQSAADFLTWLDAQLLHHQASVKP